jgi:hypothetical protein
VQLPERGEPASKAAVYHRNPVDEQQVAKPQCPGIFIVHSHVTVSMRCGPRLQADLAATQIQRFAVLYQLSWQDDLAACCRRSQIPVERIQVVRCTSRHGHP